jgi:hypothetical protein
MSIYKNTEWNPETRRIVSVDGEGKTVRGRHAYTLLAAADDTGFRECLEWDGTTRAGKTFPGERFNGGHFHANDTAPNHGLHTVDMLDFLLSIPRHKSDLIIAFAFTYDTTKILQDLPYRNLWQFASEGMTEWNGYRITGLPRKFFQVERGDHRVKIWDTFSYWQMAFAKALRSSMGLFNERLRNVIGTIERMKAERANFDVISDAEILEYCYSECECLSVLYRDFLRHCDTMQLKPNRHSGPGAMAEAFFRKIQLKEYMPLVSGDYLAGLPLEIATRSYYGGRFETRALGCIGDVIEYDLQSAYPAVAVKLPCLRHGQFRRVKEFTPGKLGFYYVGSRTSGPWAPFPFRADSASAREYLNYSSGGGAGSIAFTHGGKRWVTSFEVERAREHFGTDNIPIYSGWVWDANCNHLPFAEIRDLYVWRKIGDPSCPDCLAAPKLFCERHPSPSEGLSKLIKLIINSVYGKTAQSIGWKFDINSPFGAGSAASYARPEYQCYIWAAWITGGTRAEVMHAAALGGLEPDCSECAPRGTPMRACDDHASVYSIATDGILSTKEIPELPVTTWQLGTWERELKPDCWLGMPGIYAFIDIGKPDTCDGCRALENACDDHKSDKKFKRRGLDGRYFPATHLRGAWERGQWTVGPIGNAKCDDCQELREACPEHPPRAFMPLKLAITRTNALDVIGEWIPASKTVKFLSVQHKRILPEWADPFMPHDGGMIPLDSITVTDDVRSAPYEPKQTWEDIYAGRAEDMDIAMIDDLTNITE